MDIYGRVLYKTANRSSGSVLQIVELFDLKDKQLTVSCLAPILFGSGEKAAENIGCLQLMVYILERSHKRLLNQSCEVE